MPGPVSHAIGSLARRDKTQIGDAANIDHRDRLQKARGSRERAMKHGNERRALPAARDIGGTKIMDDFDPEFSPRECHAVADLHGQMAAGPVQDSLSVKPDQIDRRPADGTRRQKCFDRFRMAIGDHGIGVRQRPGTGVAILEQAGILDRPAQQGPVRFGIGIRSRRAKNDPLFAVGLDQGNVNAIHRGAAHETYRTKHVNWLPLAETRYFASFGPVFNARRA